MGKTKNTSSLPIGFPADFYIKFHQLVGDFRRMQKTYNSMFTMQMAMLNLIAIPNFGVTKLNVGPPAKLPQVIKDLWIKEINQTYFRLIEEHWLPALDKHFLESKANIITNMESLLAFKLSQPIQSDLLSYLLTGVKAGYNSYIKKVLKLYSETSYSSKPWNRDQVPGQYQGDTESKEEQKALLKPMDWVSVSSFSSFDILSKCVTNLTSFSLAQSLPHKFGTVASVGNSQVFTRRLTQTPLRTLNPSGLDLGKPLNQEGIQPTLVQIPRFAEVINLTTPEMRLIDLTSEDEEPSLISTTGRGDCAVNIMEQSRSRTPMPLLSTPKRVSTSIYERESPPRKRSKTGVSLSPLKQNYNCPKIDENWISSKVHWIKGDGNCLFRSLALGIYNNQDLHHQVRSRITLFLARHENRFAPFFYPERIPGANVIPRDFTHYVEILSLNGVYGGALEITAAAEIWTIGIWVFTGMDQLHSVWDESNEIYLGLRYTLRAKHYELIETLGTTAYRILKVSRDSISRTRADRDKVIDLSTPPSAAFTLSSRDTTESRVPASPTDQKVIRLTPKPARLSGRDLSKNKEELDGKFFPIPQHDTPLRRRMKMNRINKEVHLLSPTSPFHFEKTEVLPSIPEVIDLMDMPDDLIVSRISKLKGKKRRTILNLVRQYFHKRQKAKNQNKEVAVTQTTMDYEATQVISKTTLSAEPVDPISVRVPGYVPVKAKVPLILSSIFNFSSHILQQGEIDLLTKGLTFSPSTKAVQQAQFHIDLFKFCRNVRLKKHFEIHPPSSFLSLSKHPLDVTHKFNVGSIFDPDSPCKFLNTYIEGVRADMEALAKKRMNSSDNLSIKERKALTTFIDKIRNQELSVVMADKGGGTVLLDYEDYRGKGDHYFLDAQESYTLCGETEEQIIKTILKARLLVINKLLSSKVILPKHKKFGENKLYCKITGIKFLLKVHKSLNLESIPLRPIHPSIGSPNHNLSLLLDGLINPYVNSNTLPTLLRDTNQLLFFLRQLVYLPSNIVIATSDITSLYTNIPHEAGVRILSDFLLEFTAYTPAQVSAIADAVKHVVTLNYLKWQHSIYKQVRGVAMGTPVAVSYANIFMGAVDKVLSIKAPYIFKHFRFIDDNLFLIPKEFVLSLQQAYKELDFPTIRSTWTVDFDNKGISFLDVWLSIKENQIHSRLFTKPTDKHLYLHPLSYHPRHTITNIPFSVLSRVRRLCSDEQTYAEDKEKALQWLRDRGYDPKLLLKTITKVEERTGIQHILAIEDKHKLKLSNAHVGANRVPSNTIIPLTLTYSAQFKKAPSMLFRHRHTLAATLKQPHRTLVAFRRNKNLADLLVHPSYREHIQKHADDHPNTFGFFHCRKKQRYRLSKCICGLVHPEGCRVCAHSVEGLSRLPKTKYKFLMQQRANCHTRNVVYAIWCRVCAKIYVGETTQPLSARLDQHLRLMRSTTSTEVLYKHFRNHHPSNAFITPLEVIRQLEPKLLQIKESNWINKLGSLVPNGLNTQLDLNQRYKGDFMGLCTKIKATGTPTPTRALLGVTAKDQEIRGVGLITPPSIKRAATPARAIPVGNRVVKHSPFTPNTKRIKIQPTTLDQGFASNQRSTRSQVATPGRNQQLTSANGGQIDYLEPYVQISPYIFVSPKRRGIQRNLSRQRVFKS